MRSSILICGLVGSSVTPPALALSPVIAINNDAKSAHVVVLPVRANLNVLTGSGGNITVLRGANGLLLIDGGISYSKANLTQALARISNKPPKYVINTHYHWDHTDGNGWLHDMGATIVAHDRTLMHLSVSTRVDDWEWTFPPAPRNSLPTQVFSSSRTLQFEGETIELGYYGPCHTDSDIWTYFVHSDILVTGDTWWNGHFPFIDNENGGSIDGMIRAAGINIDKATDNTLIVPGHGPVGGRKELIEFRDMLVAIRAKVAGLKARGASRAEVVAANPTAEYDAKWGDFVIDGAFFARLVYDGL